ncbi:MAG: ATP-binding cassette domain-containing protein, partial [Ruminococcaceae bacterium]|nr:ATP-binding cassette domain-containing protein [Oscillospiraceae bacterium]
MAILECDKISYLYSVGTPFETAAVKEASFSCDKGEIIGVIGHTGSGKSTLIQHLNGLLEPSKGRVLLEGKDIW